MTRGTPGARGEAWVRLVWGNLAYSRRSAAPRTAARFAVPSFCYNFVVRPTPNATEHAAHMKIVNYPHPALRVKARPVTTIDEDVKKAAAEMLELMYKHNGLGLAAPQVTLDYQMTVLNFESDPERKDLEFVAINPVIVETKGGTISDREGCLSFPELYQNVRRHKTVVVKFYNLKAEEVTMECHDLAARVWQHEIDHLQGTLFIDKMGSLGLHRSQKDLEKFIADFEKAKKKGELPAGLEPKL
jgi:peptide deformylase